MGCSGAARRVYDFPVDPILVDVGLDLSTIENTKALLLVGDHDDVVGQDGARELLNGLVGLPASLEELRTIRTTDDLFASHGRRPLSVILSSVGRSGCRLDRLVANAQRRRDDGNALGRGPTEVAGCLVDVPRTDELSALDSHPVAVACADEARHTPAPLPERDRCSRIAQLADCPGDVIDAEADVMQTFTVLVEPEVSGESRSAAARAGCRRCPHPGT